MLHLLAKHARSHGLEIEPGFAPKDVRWAIELASDGRFLGVVELGDTSAKKNTGRRFARCPDLSQPELIASHGRHFLVDSLAVVALFGQEQKGLLDALKRAPEVPMESAHQKSLGQHASFLGLLKKAATACPELGIAAAGLDDVDVLRAVGEELATHGAKGTEKATLRVGGAFPVESEAWHGWWRSHRANLHPELETEGNSLAPEGRMLCFLSGELCEPAMTHPKIKGLADVGGIPMGDAVVSFDKEAFRSYGLEQGANAAISEVEAHAYTSALNSLLQEHAVYLVGAKVVHWFKRSLSPEDDPLPWLTDAGGGDVEAAAQEKARQLLTAIRTGTRPELQANEFYALTVSGCAGRVMTRDWVDGRFESLVTNVVAWFEDFSIARRDGSGLAAPPKILGVVSVLFRELKDAKKEAPSLVAQLWRAALSGGEIPETALARAIQRLRTDLYDENASPFSPARMGLLRAYHVRKGDGMLHPGLNEEHPSAAYHCGRLMAMLAAVQRAALGDVGASVVQRYYAAASTTPALVLGRLARTAQFHLGKLEPPLARWFDLRLATIWSRLSDGPPVTLGLEGQSLFALGYYQQIAADEAARQERKATAPEGNHA